MDARTRSTGKQFEDKQIPEPATLRDDYAGRTDAIHEQQQSVFKRPDAAAISSSTPPAELTRQERQEWLCAKPTEVEIEVDGVKKTLTGKELEDWKYQRYMQDYLACVQSVDDNVGRLLDWLDANGLRDNTVVIYTSDQGFFLGEHGLYDKRFMYEESLRMPFLVRWPAGDQARQRRRTRSAINCDFAPTFLDLAGQPTPERHAGPQLRPCLEGKTAARLAPARCTTATTTTRATTTPARTTASGPTTHKLIYFWKKDQWECYDLVADPQEMHNIYNDPEAQQTVAPLEAGALRG